MVGIGESEVWLDWGGFACLIVGVLLFSGTMCWGVRLGIFVVEESHFEECPKKRILTEMACFAVNFE